MFIAWLVLSYIAGALPWSVWLGGVFFHGDPREQPDRNPGTANAFRMAGWRLGVAVLLLDFFKAFIPVALARWSPGFPPEQLFWIALMPMLGHAFSVFLRFHGGRGLVVMFGVWAGLTLFSAPLVMGLAGIVALFVVKKDEYRSLAIPLALLADLLITRAPGWMALLAIIQVLVLAAKIGVYIIQSRGQNQKSIGAM